MLRKFRGHQFGQFGALLFLVLLVAATSQAQSSSFTYQGRLSDGGTAANGNYDFQFALFDSLSGGTQIGSTQTLNTVAVTNGVFTVSLDFGGSSFPGANRFLEISARPSGAGSSTLLTPRQQVTSTPYAVRSANASAADALSNTCANCVQDSQINSVSGGKVSGAVANATNATNSTNATQLGGVPASQYVQTNDTRLADARPPTAGSSNYIQNTSNQQTGTNLNISGNGTVGGTLSGNVVNAGTQFNIGGARVLTVSNGTEIVSVGIGAGNTGFGNTFIGASAGTSNTSGNANSFFGVFAGGINKQGHSNSIFGYEAGGSMEGSNNSFFGEGAGLLNETGSSNTAIGFATEVGKNLTNATAIGALASVSQSNSLVLGSIKGVNAVDAVDTNVGIGTTAPQAKLHVVGNVRVDGGITLASLGTASNPQATLCRNTSSEIAFCNSSSLRYKTNVAGFAGGMNIVNRLRPISFTWKQDGAKDIGFGAEEVEKVAPLFTFKNDKGEIEGVRYDRLGVVFVNAFKEQQAQIEKQQQQLKQQEEQIQRERAAFAAQQRQIDALKSLVCRTHRHSNVCK